MGETSTQVQQKHSDLNQTGKLQKIPALKLSLYPRLPSTARLVGFLSNDCASATNTKRLSRIEQPEILMHCPVLPPINQENFYTTSYKTEQNYCWTFTQPGHVHTTTDNELKTPSAHHM